jgi:hypothetical protein
VKEQKCAPFVKEAWFSKTIYLTTAIMNYIHNKHALFIEKCIRHANVSDINNRKLKQNT